MKSCQGSTKNLCSNLIMNSTRCAACSHLRQRCPSDCIFAPYFPANNKKRFEYVHKIYGASNIGKMLKVTQSMKNMIYSMLCLTTSGSCCNRFAEIYRICRSSSEQRQQNHCATRLGAETGIQFTALLEQLV